jgi:predicted nucleic acid-binding protein
VTTSGEAIIIDTNILLRANVEEAPLHADCSTAIKYLGRSNELWISRQVLREFVATLTRPQGFADPRPVTTIIERVRYFQAHFQVADEGPAVTERLLALVEVIPMGGKQVHDANIIAAMQVYAVPNLLTYNVVDFSRFSAYVTILTLQDVVRELNQPPAGE